MASRNPEGIMPRTTTSNGRRSRRRTRGRNVRCHRRRHLCHPPMRSRRSSHSDGRHCGVHRIIDRLAMAMLALRITRNSRSYDGGGMSDRGRDTAHSTRRRGNMGTTHRRAYGLLVVRVNDNGGGARRNGRRTASTTRRVGRCSSSCSSSSGRMNRRHVTTDARAWARARGEVHGDLLLLVVSSQE